MKQPESNENGRRTIRESEGDCMRLNLSDIGHWMGWCRRKQKSQIILDQDFMGITTTGEFTTDAKQAPERKIDTKEKHGQMALDIP